ncbi:MAG TPA: OsmC family protein [Verrucomicrobiae bacterium]
MAEHTAKIHWRCDGPDFLKGKYSREHTWTFDGGIVVPASPAPSVVPAPWSNPVCVDPEEAFVAALSSCHMLTFLFIASKQGFQVDEYEDNAVGKLSRNERGVPWISSVTLNPEISYRGEKIPTAPEEEQLHHQAHEQCFIANSVKTEVSVKKR